MGKLKSLQESVISNEELLKIQRLNHRADNQWSAVF
jgi:hypothetical protein